MCPSHCFVKSIIMHKLNWPSRERRGYSHCQGYMYTGMCCSTGLLAFWQNVCAHGSQFIFWTYNTKYCTKCYHFASEWHIFGIKSLNPYFLPKWPLKEDMGFVVSAAHPYPNWIRVPPPPGYEILTYQCQDYHCHSCPSVVLSSPSDGTHTLSAPFHRNHPPLQHSLPPLQMKYYCLVCRPHRWTGETCWCCSSCRHWGSRVGGSLGRPGTARGWGLGSDLDQSCCSYSGSCYDWSDASWLPSHPGLLDWNPCKCWRKIGCYKINAN